MIPRSLVKVLSEKKDSVWYVKERQEGEAVTCKGGKKGGEGKVKEPNTKRVAEWNDRNNDWMGDQREAKKNRNQAKRPDSMGGCGEDEGTASLKPSRMRS